MDTGDFGKARTYLTFSSNGRLVSWSRDSKVRLWDPITGAMLGVIDITFDNSQGKTLSLDSVLPNMREVITPTLASLANGDVAIECLDQKIRLLSQGRETLSEPLMRDDSYNYVLDSSPQAVLILRRFCHDTNYSQGDEAEPIVLSHGVEAELDNKEGLDHKEERDHGEEYHEENLDHEEELDDGEELDLLLYETMTGTVRCLNTKVSKSWTAVALSSQNVLATSSSHRSIELQDLNTGICSTLDQNESGGICGLRFSPNGEHLAIVASNSGNFSMRLWKLETRTSSVIGTFTLSPALSFSPNNKRIATGDFFSVSLWDVPTERLSDALNGPIDAASSICYSPDFTRIYNLSKNKGSIKAYNSYTQDLEFTLEDDSNCGFNLEYNTRLIISENGSKLVYEASYGNIHLWVRILGRLVGSFILH